MGHWRPRREEERSTLGMEGRWEGEGEDLGEYGMMGEILIMGGGDGEYGE